MISGQWFIEDLLRISQNLHKVTHDSIEIIRNKAGTLNLTILVGIHPRNIYKIF